MRRVFAEKSTFSYYSSCGLCCGKIIVLTVRIALVWIFRLILYGSGAQRFRKRSVTPAVGSVAERDLRPRFHWDSCVYSDRHWNRREQSLYEILAFFTCQETFNWYYTSLFRIKCFTIFVTWIASLIHRGFGVKRPVTRIIWFLFWMMHTCKLQHWFPWSSIEISV